MGCLKVRKGRDQDGSGRNKCSKIGGKVDKRSVVCKQVAAQVSLSDWAITILCPHLLNPVPSQPLFPSVGSAVLMVLLGIHALSCCWLDLGTWSCGWFVSGRLGQQVSPRLRRTAKVSYLLATSSEKGKKTSLGVVGQWFFFYFVHGGFLSSEVKDCCSCLLMSSNKALAESLGQVYQFCFWLLMGFFCEKPVHT